MDDKSVKKISEIVKTRKRNINISLVKQITITTEFMIRVTTMRRILDDLELYMQKKNILLDCKIFFWLVLLILHPFIFSIFISIYMYFFIDMQGLNHTVLTKLLYYFSGFVDEDDEKKNLEHIQKTQTSILFILISYLYQFLY